MSLLGLNPYPNPKPKPNQATMSLLGALSCSRLRVPLPGLAELRAAGPLPYRAVHGYRVRVS